MAPRWSLRAPAALLTAALALMSCGPAFVVDGVPLEGTTWILVTVAGQPPASGREPNLTFHDGTLSAWFGCNSGGAQRVDISGSSISVHELVSTAMACVDAGEVDPQNSPIMRTEIAYMNALEGASRIAIRDEQLLISGSGGDLVFRRHQPGESLGHI